MYMKALYYSFNPNIFFDTTAQRRRSWTQNIFHTQFSPDFIYFYLEMKDN